MERNHLPRQLAVIRKSLFDQGYLDDQFDQLEKLQDDVNPNFAEEVVTLFYRDSTRLVQNIEHALNFSFFDVHGERNPLDFAKLEGLMHQFKDSCSSIGARKVKYECTQFREHCRVANAEGCKRSFLQLKKEYTTLQKKLKAYFQFARQAGPVEVACRPN